MAVLHTFVLLDWFTGDKDKEIMEVTSAVDFVTL